MGASEVRGRWVPGVLSQGLCFSEQFWLVALAMGMYLTWGLRAELGMESLFQRNLARSPSWLRHQLWSPAVSLAVHLGMRFADGIQNCG